MLGLYQRDYSVLTQDEIKEKEKLESESRDENSMFSTNLYYDYSKSVRHNMSLFPNNFMDNVDLQDNQDELKAQCDLID